MAAHPSEPRGAPSLFPALLTRASLPRTPPTHPSKTRRAARSRASRAAARVQTAVVPKIAPLQRTITEHLQGARDRAGGTFQKSELGRRMSERAQSTIKEQKLEPWEKEIIASLEQPAPAKK